VGQIPVGADLMDLPTKAYSQKGMVFLRYALCLPAGRQALCALREVENHASDCTN